LSKLFYKKTLQIFEEFLRALRIIDSQLEDYFVEVLLVELAQLEELVVLLVVEELVVVALLHQVLEYLELIVHLRDT
jgi:hypothetical protein